MDLQVIQNKVQMVDLISQHNKIRKELDAAIKEVIDTASFIKGKQVSNFENDLASYLGSKHVIGCANGTDALQIALMSLDLPKGAEIIVPDFTFIATAEVIALLGYTPVFVDVERNSFNLSLSAIEQAITDNTKVIMPVHMFGQCCNMESILALAKKHQLYVVEDTAQAMGAEYTFSNGTVAKAGTMGHAGCTSFFPSKNLSCMGDGGAVFTNDDDIAVKMQTIANHGMSSQYEYQYVGINSRLDSLQAAVLSVKLKYLDEYNQARRNAAKAYSERLKDIEQLICPMEDSFSHHIFHQYTLIVKDDSRDELQKFLASKEIPTKVYYPLPFHAHAPYATFPHDKSKLTNSIYLCKHVISLPMHSELSIEQIDYITSLIIEFYKN